MAKIKDKDKYKNLVKAMSGLSVGEFRDFLEDRLDDEEDIPFDYPEFADAINDYQFARTIDLDDFVFNSDVDDILDAIPDSDIEDYSKRNMLATPSIEPDDDSFWECLINTIYGDKTYSLRNKIPKEELINKFRDFLDTHYVKKLI